jgi:hypothetical protein
VACALEYSGLGTPYNTASIAASLGASLGASLARRLARSEPSSGLAVLVGSQESSGLAGIQWPRRIAIAIAQVVKVVEEAPKSVRLKREDIFSRVKH